MKTIEINGNEFEVYHAFGPDQGAWGFEKVLEMDRRAIFANARALALRTFGTFCGVLHTKLVGQTVLYIRKIRNLSTNQKGG